jgi:hypothetical protein
MAEYPHIGLIVIDTFQKASDNTNHSYAEDYMTIGKIKAFADAHRIAIPLLHHTRKMPDTDDFNTLSGSTGITGAADNIYILKKHDRLSTEAQLLVTGRDIEDMQLNLEIIDNVWRFISFKNSNDLLIDALTAMLSSRGEFEGTATELLSILNEYEEISLSDRVIKRKLTELAPVLMKEYGIIFEPERTGKARKIKLSFRKCVDDDNNDDDDNPTW